MPHRHSRLLTTLLLPSCLAACSGGTAADDTQGTQTPPLGSAGTSMIASMGGTSNVGNATDPVVGTGGTTFAPPASGGVPASVTPPATGGTLAEMGGSPAMATGGALTAGGAAAMPSGMDDPPPPRPINVEPGDNVNFSFNGQSMTLNKSKPIQGKLFLLLGGICTGTGAGGFESFVRQYGFHVFAPRTDTCVNSAPQEFKDMLDANPMDPEANRQVADARMELWDGVDRVDWVEVAPGESILDQTIAAMQYGAENDPGSDWGYFLNEDGTLRTSDVYVVGYSWGAQTWSMISSYVRFGKVIATSGPTPEGFPNATWITDPGPNATPADRKYVLVDLHAPYPSMENNDEGNMQKFEAVINAGWGPGVTSVTPEDLGPYMPEEHLFAMIGSNGASPGGHTVFCNDNPDNGWAPLCRHVLGVE